MRYIEFNGIKFTSESDTNYIYNYFNPNDGDTSYQSDVPLGYDGEIISNITYNSRVVNVKGYVWGDTEQELYNARQELFNKCNGKTKGILTYFDGFKLYRANAVASVPSCGAYEGTCCSFNVNFTLYSFFWEDESISVFDAFKRTDKVTTSFTLPCVFTERVSDSTIVNDTDFDIFPIIVIKTNSIDNTQPLEIINNRTGEKIIIFGYNISVGEIITIDCEKYTAQNNSGVNLINYFNDFENWRIVKGANEIKVNNGNTQSSINIKIQYRKKYVGV